MENASKALIMASTVLIGVMIISLGVYLFNTFGGTSKEINTKLTEAQILEFNSQFTKYEGKEKIRAHDIVSIANLARQSNEKYYGKDYKYLEVKNEPYYISVIVTGTDQFNSVNFENKEEINFQDFIKTETLNGTSEIYFKCTDLTISNITRLVTSIKFTK